MAVYVDKELCKSCRICISLCPENVFEMSQLVNKKGYNFAESVRESDCTGCRLCDISCPDEAVYVE